MSDPGRDAVAARVPRGTLATLDQYVALLREEGERQNLIAASTMATIWQRHILDSLQLADLAGEGPGLWLDVGSGAGLPGLVIAAATEWHVTLVEPRQLRARFLAEAADALDLDSKVTIRAERCETVVLDDVAAVISARAVAPLSKLLAIAEHLAGDDTRWLLPKGRSAAVEVAEAQRSWQGEFRLVPSLTESAAMIVDARQVRRKRQR